MVYLVVRVRGTVNVPYWARTTLNNLNLHKRFHATILPENSQSLNMLRKVKEVVAWTSVVDAQVIKELLEKRGRKAGFRSITDSDLPKGYKSINDLASDIAENKVAMSKLENIKPWFALNPPRGGFKRRTKTQYSQKGVLGNNKELVDIVKRML
jgi:large subunit ribosomal protein L30